MKFSIAIKVHCEVLAKEGKELPNPKPMSDRRIESTRAGPGPSSMSPLGPVRVAELPKVRGINSFQFTSQGRVSSFTTMANFFSREAKVMLIWSLSVPAILFVVAVLASFFLRDRLN
jgi:hypothetical protein